MADGGPPAPRPSPLVPVPPPSLLVELPAPPMQQNQPAQPQLNWSYFKPEFSGKPEDDAEAHLLKTNDWMETRQFQDLVKVQRFCLTLKGKVRF